jgi:hypothetical protein
MLRVFYLGVAYVCNDFQMFSGVVSSVSEACFKCFICFQTYAATILHLDVLKVDRVLHISFSPSVVLPRCLLLLAPVGHLLSQSPPLLDAGDVRGGMSLAWACKTARETDCGRPDAPSV